MAESPEHEFLSMTFLDTLDEFSRARLYTYREASRRKFDFACDLVRDWTRPLVGQTLWKHSEGVDKDLRTMLTQTDANIWAYVARDNVKSRALIHEAVADYRQTSHHHDLHRLKVIWVPADFDADSERDRLLVKDLLRQRISTDILFNVVFGNLTRNDIRYFLSLGGVFGLKFAVLHTIATQQMTNYTGLANELESNPSTVRRQVLDLLPTGLIWRYAEGVMYYASLKGRVFLDLCSQFLEAHGTGNFSSELLYIAKLLDLEPNTDDPHLNAASAALYGSSDSTAERYAARRAIAQMAEGLLIPASSPAALYKRLMSHLLYGIAVFDLDFASMSYVIDQREQDPWWSLTGHG